jgi:hypothetical protein
VVGEGSCQVMASRVSSGGHRGRHPPRDPSGLMAGSWASLFPAEEAGRAGALAAGARCRRVSGRRRRTGLPPVVERHHKGRPCEVGRIGKRSPLPERLVYQLFPAGTARHRGSASCFGWKFPWRSRSVQGEGAVAALRSSTAVPRPVAPPPMTTISQAARHLRAVGAVLRVSLSLFFQGGPVLSLGSYSSRKNRIERG